MGVVVSETTRETRMANDRVRANSRNRRPSIPCIKRMGVNTAIREMLIERTVNPTSRAPSKAASSRDIPLSKCREIFSKTTIASSTTKPVEIVRAINDRIFKLKFIRYMAPNVPMIETGTAMLGMIAERKSPRNRKTMIVTSTTAMTSVRSVSLSEARIVGLRSKAILTLIAAGMAASSGSSSALTRSTVSMMLAPGWR